MNELNLTLPCSLIREAGIVDSLRPKTVKSETLMKEHRTRISNPFALILSLSIKTLLNASTEIQPWERESGSIFKGFQAG